MDKGQTWQRLSILADVPKVTIFFNAAAGNSKEIAWNQRFKKSTEKLRDICSRSTLPKFFCNEKETCRGKNCQVAKPAVRLFNPKKDLPSETDRMPYSLAVNKISQKIGKAKYNCHDVL